MNDKLTALPGDDEGSNLTDHSQPASSPEALSNQSPSTIDSPDEVDSFADTVNLTLNLAEGMRVRVIVEALSDGENAGNTPRLLTVYESPDGTAEAKPVHVRLPITLDGSTATKDIYTRKGTGYRRWAGLLPLSIERLNAISLGQVLFILGLLVYLSTRLIGLTRFPIYFFTDEAAQTVLASDLVRDHFKNYTGEFLPAFFENGGNYRLGVSVYAQVLPYLMFGKSVFVTRATSVLLTLIAAISIGLILRDIFKLNYWWSGVLFLSITPAWFLHSRTAFEVALGVSFYALFLYAYLLYRYRDPRYLYLAVAAGSLAFYSFSPFQIIMPVTAVLLAAIDWRYHRQNRRTVLISAGILLIAAIPYVRFLFAHRQANAEVLSGLGSYLTQRLPPGEKLQRFVVEYLRGLDPAYWFLPDTSGVPRHIMKGYGNLTRWTLPFILWGLCLSIWRARPGQPLAAAYRVILVAILSVPVGAAVVQVGITRLLALVIPVCLLTVLGLESLMVWLERFRLPRSALEVVVFVGLILANPTMLRDALINGPTWFEDYGMGGMQYGSSQIFSAIKTQKEEYSDDRIIFSPTWANGTDVLARFFLPDPLPIELGSVTGHLFEVRPLDERTLFVMTPEEYKETLASGKFTDIRVEKTLPYPNSKPGFYFVRMKYVPNIAEMLAMEIESRRNLITDQVTVNEKAWTVGFSSLDIGEIHSVFDGDSHTFVRSFEANPLILDIVFPEVATLEGLDLNIGSAELEVKAELYDALQGEAVTYTQTLKGSETVPTVSLPFSIPTRAQRVRIELKDPHQEEPGHVHLWDLQFR